MSPLTVEPVADLELARKLIANPANKAYQAIGHALELFQAREREVVAEGPADCVAGETRIYDPVADSHTAIATLYRERRASWVLTLNGPARATAPFIKGVADLYRVTIADGRSCLVTDRHLLLTHDGWTYCAHLSPGQMLRVGEPCPLVSTSDTDRPIHWLGAPHLIRTRAGLPSRYVACPYPGDAPLHGASSSARGAVLPLIGVRAHSRGGHSGDGQAPAPGHSHLDRSGDRPATWDCLILSEAGQREQSPVAQETGGRGAYWHRSAVPSLTETPRPTPTPADRRRVGHTPHRSAIAPLLPPSMGQWMTVSSITYERTDVYYDLTVPTIGHYLAEGIWHHNSGKSRAALEKLHACMRKYPGARGAMVRKVRASLTTTAMETFDRFVVVTGDCKLWHDQEYRYPNKSKIVLLGLDDVEKVKSSEFDMVYVQETSELDEDDWEILTTRVTGRGAVMPYVQLIADQNPIHPDFWLYQREAAGKVRYINFTHADNPTITPERLAALDALTGYRYKRLRLGLRVAAEGMYFEEWDPARHICEPFDIPAHWPRWASVDYGFAAPWCVLFAARDPVSRRVYIYREIYQTGVRDEQQARVLRPHVVADRVRRVAADPSMFNERKEQGKVSIAQVYAAGGVVLTKASNARIAGWQAVRRILAWNEHEPRLQVMRGRAPNLVRTLPAMVIDPFNSEDLAHEIKGKETDDHACLVAGTMIDTPSGPVPIETVAVGDRVWTRGGLRPVEVSMMTDPAATVWTVTLHSGRKLTGTGNHPVWVDVRWVRLDAIEPGDCLWGRDKIVKNIAVEPARQPVYNLTVAYQHEYFANGILVSNCDCLRYLVVDEAMPAGQRVARDHEVSDE